ncbi:hypothetical protein [Geminicoccus harenae]|uniref:hypothetical protein n=1 Tax=Geminicoccus harenae TaxID=2498453 RepID=UPI001C94E86A|nr:hypothetical protein [Geminicoccus harenae]
MKLRPLPPLLGLAVVALLGSVSPASLLAQEAAEEPGITVRLQGGAPAGENVVDEALLRYLASRGDRAAAEAEIARLKELHPDWEPPSDLFGGLPKVDEGPLWQLYESGDYAAVRSRIEALRKERPDWTPPQKLVTLMAVNEARAASEAAAAAGDWASVVALFDAQPAAATCEHVDNLWRLAEAQQRTGAGEAALATYARIITTCPDADHRFATLQKAKLLVPPAELERLVGLEKARTGSPERLAKLETLTARPTAPAGSRPAGPDFSRIYKPGASVGDARAVADAVIRRRDAAAARKIGWIYQAAGDDAAAAPWFQRSLDWAPGEEAARGLAMSLAALGKLPELDALAARYPEVVTQARGGQVAVAVDRGDLATVLKLTRQTGKPAELLMRSWTYMKLLRPTEAQLSFARVMAAPDAMPLQRDEAVYGLIRAQIAQHLFQDAAQSIERYGLPPDQYNEVQAELLSQEIQVAFRQKDYRRTVALLEKRRDFALPDRGLEIQEAWARYHTGEVHTARRIFTRLDRIVSTEETEAGLAQVSRKLGPGW